MKLHYYFLPLCLGLGCFSSCSSDDEEMFYMENESNSSKFETLATFPEKDGSTKLGGNVVRKIFSLLKKTGTEIGMTLPPTIEITQEQYNEIKEFTDDLVADLTIDKEKYSAIFNWITKNIRYEYGDNQPYAVFKNRFAICQGYANLLNVMLNTQGIPVININGMLDPIGGHAWNYVYVNKSWVVSDPTNNRDFPIEPLTGYPSLIPASIDAHIFPTEDNVCNFSNEQFNLLRVRKANDAFVVPFSSGGIRITSFDPDSLLPANVREIYIGSNIESFGPYIGLKNNAPNVERVYVDPANTALKEYKSVVYNKKTNQLLYIPNNLKVVEILPVDVLDKNYITYQDGMEELIIPSGVQELRAYAVESCKNLKKAYVPEGVVIDPQAFYNVHPDFEIVRQDLTGIPEITM